MHTLPTQLINPLIPSQLISHSQSYLNTPHFFILLSFTLSCPQERMSSQLPILLLITAFVISLVHNCASSLPSFVLMSHHSHSPPQSYCQLSN